MLSAFLILMFKAEKLGLLLMIMALSIGGMAILELVR